MDYIDLVKAKESELKDLRDRQDKDRNLLYLQKYVLTDASNKRVPDIIHVTLNRPAVFAANVISSLNKTAEQRAVTSNDRTFDTRFVEDLLKAAFASANERLRKRGEFPLNPFFDEQSCIRGTLAARCLFRMGEGLDGKEILIPDITPWDTRFVTYEVGENGLEWAAYSTKRTRDLILADYGVTIDGEKGDVVDVWYREGNEVYIDGNKVMSQPHDYGFTPVAISMVTSGSMLQDEDALVHRGESIFFLIRDVIPELNRLSSIMQTLNMKAIKPPMKFKSKGGTRATPPSYEDATDMATITALDDTGDIAPIDYGDAKASAQLAYAMFDKAMQEGSLSSIDLGTLGFELSAIALIEIGEGRDQVFSPRLEAKARLNKELSEMIIEQCIQLGGSVELGTMGHRRDFKTSQLNGEFDINYKYFPKSPKVDMARFSMSAAIGNVIPEKAKRIEILQREDPDEDERQLRYEAAEMLSPAIRINRTIMALVEMGEDFEAELLSAEMGVNLEQMLRGEITVGTEEPAKPQASIPGLAEGLDFTIPQSPQTTPQKKASIVKKTPRGE